MEFSGRNYISKRGEKLWNSNMKREAAKCPLSEYSIIWTQKVKEESLPAFSFLSSSLISHWTLLIPFQLPSRPENLLTNYNCKTFLFKIFKDANFSSYFRMYVVDNFIGVLNFTLSFVNLFSKLLIHMIIKETL